MWLLGPKSNNLQQFSFKLRINVLNSERFVEEEVPIRRNRLPKDARSGSSVEGL